MLGTANVARQSAANLLMKHSHPPSQNPKLSRKQKRHQNNTPGPKFPLAPLHRQASCTPASRGAKPPACTPLTALIPPAGASAFAAAAAASGGAPRANPSTLYGALVAGPGADDGYEDSRLSPGARVGVHFNAPLVGALAGLLQRGASQQRCQAAGGFLSELLRADDFL